MKLRTDALLVCAWTIAGIGVLHGQQAFGNEFDLNRPVHLEGTITNLKWANPHVVADIAVPDTNGGTAVWLAELTAPNSLTRAGVVRNEIQVGDTVVVDGFAAKSETRRVGSSSIHVKDSGITVVIPAETWHHSYAELYDSSSPAQQSGKITGIDWVNPRPIAHFTVATPDGRMQEWLAELPPLSILNRQGWKQSTLISGDEIQIAGASAKDGSRRLLVNRVILIAAGGVTLAAPRTLWNVSP